MSTSNEILVFRPTYEEFQHFARYVTSIQPYVTAGICKVIPPAQWWAVMESEIKSEVVDSMIIESPARQNVFGAKGVYKVLNVTEKNRTVKSFREFAQQKQPYDLLGLSYIHDNNNSSNNSGHNATTEEVARKFWKNITYDAPIYGGDMPGSFMKDKAKIKQWNLNNLGTLLDLPFVPKILGMNTPYLYFGMWKALFALHTEDLDLFSINFLHFGAAKYWYSVPPRYASNVESLAQRCFREDYQECSQFLRHKSYLLSPTVLAANGIPCYHTQQNQGEFILTFPQAYHFGFNSGFNCAESTNFALETWLPYGLKAQFCKCVEYAVKLNLKAFAIGPGLCYREGRAHTPSHIVEEKWYNGDLLYCIQWKDIKECSWERAAAYDKPYWKSLREKWRASKHQTTKPLTNVSTTSPISISALQSNEKSATSSLDCLASVAEIVNASSNTNSSFIMLSPSEDQRGVVTASEPAKCSLSDSSDWISLLKQAQMAPEDSHSHEGGDFIFDSSSSFLDDSDDFFGNFEESSNFLDELLPSSLLAPPSISSVSNVASAPTPVTGSEATLAPPQQNLDKSPEVTEVLVPPSAKTYTKSDVIVRFRLHNTVLNIFSIPRPKMWQTKKLRR